MSLPLESFNSLNVEVVRFVRNGLEYSIQVLSPNVLSRTGKTFRILQGLPL